MVSSGALTLSKSKAKFPIARSRFIVSSSMLKKICRSKFFCLACGILLMLFMSLSLLIIGPTQAQAQQVSDLQTVNVDATSKQASPTDAVKEATTWATIQTAKEHVIEIMGQASYDKNKAAVNQKIFRQTNRFIPFVNPGAPVEQKDKSLKVPVELKISLNSLRKILVDEGFFAQGSDGAVNTASLLPLITFTDRTKAQSMRWWMGDEKQPELKFLVGLEQLMTARLSEEVTKQQLVLTKVPQTDVPEKLQIERPSPQDLSALAAYFKSAMVARGDVRVIPSSLAGSGTISVKIQVVQASAPDRVIAEVVGEFASDAHASSLEAGLRAKANVEFAALSKDLATQVQAAWQRGTMGTHFINLSVHGALDPRAQAAFKAEFIRTVHEVRDLKERLFETESVTYEADYSGDLASFESRLRALKLTGFDVRVEGQSGERGLTLAVRPTGQVN